MPGCMMACSAGSWRFDGKGVAGKKVLQDVVHAVGRRQSHHVARAIELGVLLGVIAAEHAGPGDAGFPAWGASRR